MRRRGLSALLRVASRGLVNTVLVTHGDRLARFGLELLERLFSDYRVALEVVHEKTQTTPQEELVTDLMALIASFSKRLYGLRASSIRCQHKHDS
jgi:putative resolvase